MALVSPGIQISINDQSQYVNSNVGSVPLVLLATAQDKTYNNSPAVGTSKANAGKLLSFTSQRDLVTALGTPKFQLSSAGTPINGSELNEYGLLTAYSALGLGNQLYAIRADIDLAQLTGTSVRPAGKPADGQLWLDTGNSEFGIYELDNTSATPGFVHETPIVITDVSKVTYGTYVGASGSTSNVTTPKPSVGKPGDYALVAVSQTTLPVGYIRLFNKTNSSAVASGSGGPGSNTWVQVGSPEWQLSRPVVTGSATNPTLTLTAGSSTVSVNGTTVTFNTATVAALAAAVNAASITGVKAQVNNGKLSFYVTSSASSSGSGADGKLILVESDSTNTPLNKAGITAGSGNPYYCPYFFYGTYAQQPSGGWFATDSQPRPSGSVWWKTSSVGNGFNPSIKKYNASTDTWVPQQAPMFQVYTSAITALDPVGGGANLTAGQLVATYAVADTTYNGLQISTVNFHNGTTIASATGDTPTAITGSFTITASGIAGASNTATVPALSSGTASDFVTAVLAANVPYVTAILNSNGTVTIEHTLGGQITLTNVGTDTPLQSAGFRLDNTSYKPFQRVGYTVNPITNTVSISNFLSVTSNTDFQSSTPTSAPSDGTLWYYSNPADVDIMINTSAGWKGYLGAGTDSRGYVLGNTDPNGVIVSASVPVAQSDSSSLVAGDLWLDTSDLANYPSLNRYNGTAWVAIDNTDHVSSNGIIFADARWSSDGTSDPITDDLPSTVSLLSSNYIDLDAPNYKLYPRGTLLFNTRRSGYNVKKFVSNYFNSTSFPAGANSLGYPPSTPSVTNSWVSDSGLDENGVMKSGSAAQRAIVVAALQSAVDSNIDVREETYNFNLLVAPGYPELIDNLVTLNDDRGSTGFIIGDTPMTLTPSVTDLTAWSNNTGAWAGTGLATASPYLGVYYPAGLTNDLAGNTVAVPASHAALRTFLYNDNVSYQWFAPAGVHRGLVSNLSDIGYVDSTSGSFIHNGINQGLRDALYTLNINPITQLPGTGLVIWGQETRSGDTTSRNKINVVRLENYLRTVFKTISNGFLFEPNDTVTRKTIARQIESALHDVLSKRGLYDFLVICDTNNNPPSAIANDQLYVDVAVEPMRDVEFIYIPIALYNPGTIANLGASNT
jgi:hypothetical protein